MFCSLLLGTLTSACDDSISPNNLPLGAPNRTLPARDIMQMQGITSIHFIEYYYTIVNGDSDQAFTPAFEYYIDTARVKMKQYYFDNPDWNVTVYDLTKNLVWNYYNGTVTFPQLPNLQSTFEIEVQARLGSWLKGPIQFLGTEDVQSVSCLILTDTTGYVEWVWPQYKLPIQRRTESTHRGIHQIGYKQLRQVEINVAFPDTLFDPPS